VTGAPDRDIKLSAVIPNYNHGAFIGRAVAAMLAQSLAPDEIVIVDDASTDDSREVIAALQQTHPGIIRTVAHERNLGAIAALNRGLTEARGAYVYFGSADDVTRPILFERMTALLDAHPDAALACGETRLVDLQGKVLGYRPITRPAQTPAFLSADDARALIARTDHWILTGASVYRTDAMRRIGGFDGGFGSFADSFASKRLALRHGFCFTPEVVADWRIDPEGYSRKSAADPEVSLALIARLRAAIDGDAAFPPHYGETYERRWRFAVCRLAIAEDPINLDLLHRLGCAGPVDRLCASLLAHVRPASLGRLLLLCWAAFRLRPTSPFRVLHTYMARRLG
jgi:glycosyltransferase involved in cell wall biosynthesis